MSKVQNLRSSVKDKLPTSDQLEIGQLALNVNSESPMIAFKTSEGSVVCIKAKDEWVGTQAQYNALDTRNINTTYYIVEG